MGNFTTGHSEQGKGATCAPLAALLSCLVALLSGCSLLPSMNDGQDHRWLRDGSLAISRPLPPINTTSRDRSRMNPSASMQSVRPSATLLRVSRAAGKLSIEGPDTPPMSFYAQVSSSMRPGRYTVNLKQANPLWYAPDSYFRQRSLRLPPEGSKERFKRGALGSQALFLDEQTPIHSGPIGLVEIGGLRISPTDMATIFQSVQVGTVVEVR